MSLSLGRAGSFSCSGTDLVCGAVPVLKELNDDHSVEADTEQELKHVTKIITSLENDCAKAGDASKEVEEEGEE